MWLRALRLPLYSLDFRVWTEELGVKVGGKKFFKFQRKQECDFRREILYVNCYPSKFSAKLLCHKAGLAYPLPFVLSGKPMANCAHSLCSLYPCSEGWTSQDSHSTWGTKAAHQHNHDSNELVQRSLFTKQVSQRKEILLRKQENIRIHALL